MFESIVRVSWNVGIEHKTRCPRKCRYFGGIPTLFLLFLPLFVLLAIRVVLCHQVCIISTLNDLIFQIMDSNQFFPSRVQTSITKMCYVSIICLLMAIIAYALLAESMVESLMHD